MSVGGERTQNYASLRMRVTHIPIVKRCFCHHASFSRIHHAWTHSIDVLSVTHLPSHKVFDNVQRDYQPSTTVRKTIHSFSIYYIPFVSQEKFHPENWHQIGHDTVS